MVKRDKEMKETKKTKRPPLDKEKLGLEYRAGVKSLRQLATEYGISAPRVVQVAQEEGWERDLSVRIAAQAQDKLNRAALNTELNTEQKKASEREVVEANAEMQKNLILEHRSDAKKNRAIVVALIAELEALTSKNELFEQLAEVLAEDTTERAREAFNRVIGFASRVDSAKKLTETMRILIAIERQAFGISDGADNAKAAIEDVIRRIEDEEKVNNDGSSTK